MRKQKRVPRKLSTIIFQFSRKSLVFDAVLVVLLLPFNLGSHFSH